VALRPHLEDDDCEPNHLSKRAFCPPFTYGYSLARKEWCRFYVDNIRKVQWKENSFDSLVIKDSQKLVLRALVSSHAFPSDVRDQTRQKGKGLVILLHGSPGSGKTLTAGQLQSPVWLSLAVSLTLCRVCCRNYREGIVEHNNGRAEQGKPPMVF
jgi:hypothetical protein